MKAISVIVLIFLFNLTVYAQPLSVNDEWYIDSVMSAHYKQNGPGAVILIARDGFPVYRKSYGLANLELNVTNKPDGIFRIGSMSKQFTAVCMLKLVQENKLDLQDDITKYLTGYNTHGRHITIENLLTHTSGITSYTEKSDFDKLRITDQSKKEMISYFMNDSLLFEPGTDWSYSNSGYMLAGLIIEKVSGKSLEQYLQENIFSPLGMSSTSIGNYDSVQVNAVYGYEDTGAGKYKPAGYMSWSWPFGAGNILSTVDDLLKWDNALYTDKIVDHLVLEKAWKSYKLNSGQETNYGFGWSVCKYEGMEILSHGGAINGFLSNGIRFPSQHLYLVILSNSSSVPNAMFSTSIAMKLAGKEINTSEFIRPGKKVLNEYTGVYPIHRYESRITSNSTNEKLYRYIRLRDDTLFSLSTGESPKKLKCISADLFTFENSNIRYRFHRNKKGAVESLEVYNEPVQYGPSELELKTDIPLPKEKQVKIIDARILNEYTGKYDFGDGFMIAVSVAGSKIFIQPTNQDLEEIFAESETKFFLKSVDATIEFITENGVVTGMVLNQAGKYNAKKIE